MQGSNAVDLRAVRVAALMVVALALMSLWRPAAWLSGFLFMDFVMRGWVDRRYSPLAWLAGRVVTALGFEPRYGYAPPKRFAARIGSVVTAAMVAFHLAGMEAAALVATLLILVCCSLESVFGFCVGCWMYSYVGRVVRKPQHSIGD